MRAGFWGTLEAAWHICSKGSLILMLTRSIKWPTGAYGRFDSVYLTGCRLIDIASPLPDEMFFYARADTHYLLYIYDNLRNELLDGSNQSVPEENKIEHVLQRSKETSLLRFQRQIYDEDTGQGPAGWYQLLVKTPALLNNEQFAVFRAIHAWRDRIARKDDDSTSFVMPNHVIFTLAKAMPVDMTSFYGAVHPISHNVKSRASELLALIKSAKEAGQDGPTMMDVLRPDSVGAAAKANGTKFRNPCPAVSPILASADQGQLRSEKSVFWGTAFGSSIWDPSPATSSSTTHLRLAVPLPQVASELMSDSPSTDPSQLRDSQLPSSIAQKITSTQATNTSEEEVFVIKSGRKRKAQELDTVQQESEGPSGEYDISLNEEEEEAARIKTAEKAEKKAQKKAKKAAKKLASQNASGDATPNQVEEEEPFDYGKADSVLHGKGKDAGNHDSKRKKPFDPYAKSADAPKGMRRLQTERAGKSFTFKS
jgi:exosome complex exonuclease RRP6